MREALNVEVIAVLTKQRKEFGNGTDIASLARTNNITVLDSLKELPVCDIIYSVQYHQILKQDTIDKATRIAVNLHMAPLPEYRGCNQFTMAIIDGRKEFGTTLHQIDTRIDHGDILFEKRFVIPEDCWVNDLYEKTCQASLELFRASLESLISGNYELKSQKNLEEQKGTALHFRDEIASLKQIDLSWDADKIDRYIRATSMPGFEPPFTIIGGEKVYFTTENPA